MAPYARKVASQRGSQLALHLPTRPAVGPATQRPCAPTAARPPVGIVVLLRHANGEPRPDVSARMAIVRPGYPCAILYRYLGQYTRQEAQASRSVHQPAKCGP